MTQTENRRRVAFRTFGCRLNQYDTETLRTLLEQHGGWHTVAYGEDADVYVVNTCSVTSQADANARKAIRRIHTEHPQARIVVTGCYAQRAAEEIAVIPGVNLVLGAADRADIASKIDSAFTDGPHVAVSPISEAKTFLDVPITEMMERSRAFVKIQEGCNESCSFCIVPQTRGASRSRSVRSVLSQARGLIAAGYTELVITGVHVGDYGLDLPASRRLLPELICELLALPGLQRFRLSSIEPSTVTSDLIALMSSEEKFARHFHIPFQSGSNEILARMKRRYVVEEFARTLEQIAGMVPDCGIGTDVIAGFPGETDAHFQSTFDWLEKLPITYLHPFTYSARPGSEAQAYDDQLPGDVKKRRTRSLRRLSREKNLAFREAHVGRVLSVMVEREAPIKESTLVMQTYPDVTQASGLTDNYLSVRFAAPAGLEGLHAVRITGVTDTGLMGELANPTAFPVGGEPVSEARRLVR